jgi:hypothetical protein
MIDEKKLEERLVALEAAKSWSPRVVSRLETLLRSGADETLYRINPLRFAADKSIADAEAVDLFLHACVAGCLTWTGCLFVRPALTWWRASAACARCTAISTVPSARPTTKLRSTILSQ